MITSFAAKGNRYYSRLVRETIRKGIKPKTLRIKRNPGLVAVPPDKHTEIEIPANYQIEAKLPKRKSNDTLSLKHGAHSVLFNNALLVARQLEMLSVFLGYEQANKYSLKNYKAEDVGFLAEKDQGFKNVILRQLLRTRRAFDAEVLDVTGKPCLKILRPIKWFLNSTTTITTSDGKIIGRVESDWHLWRRRYNLFVGDRYYEEQFGRIDSPFLSWDFETLTREGKIISAINRNFSGFIKEIFTDMGQYVVHFDATMGSETSLSLDERAVLLGAAVSIDIDYFSRHSNHSSTGLVPAGLMGTPLPVSVPIPVAGDVAGGVAGGIAGDVAGGVAGGLAGDIAPGNLGGLGKEQGGIDSSSTLGSSEKNQWGDDAFLSDQQAGISDAPLDESGETFWDSTKQVWDAFNDDG